MNHFLLLLTFIVIVNVTGSKKVIGETEEF